MTSSPTDKKYKKRTLPFKSAAVQYSRGCALLRRFRVEAWLQSYGRTHPNAAHGGWWIGGLRAWTSRELHRLKKQTMKTNLPALLTAAFTWRSAAAGLTWWPSDGREEEHRQGVRTTD